MGEHADDAGVLAHIRANKWDSSDNGSGNPRSGMLYFNTATAKIMYHNGTVWADPSGGAAILLKSKSFIITAPVAGSNSPVWRTPEAITVTSVSALCVGGTNVIGHVWKHDINGANGASLGASDITATAGTNVTTSSLVGASLTAGQYIGFKTTSVTGVITRLIVTFDYN